MRRRLIIHTGVAATDPAGPGGWAWIDATHPERRQWGWYESVTPARAELLAVIHAATDNYRRAIDHDRRLIITTPNTTGIVTAFSHRWWQHWRTNQWHTTHGEPVEHHDLWQTLIDLHQAADEPLRLELRPAAPTHPCSIDAAHLADSARDRHHSRV